MALLVFLLGVGTSSPNTNGEAGSGSFLASDLPLAHSGFVDVNRLCGTTRPSSRVNALAALDLVHRRHAGVLDDRAHALGTPAEREQRVLAERRQDVGVGRADAAHRADAVRLVAVEEHDEAGDAAFDDLFVHDVGALQAGERLGVGRVLDLHGEHRPVGRLLVAGQGLAGEGAG